MVINMKVALFGVGKYIDGIEQVLQKDVEIIFYIDNNMKFQNMIRKGKKIYSIHQCEGMEVDYIIISALNYVSIEKQLYLHGYSSSKVIPYFKENLPFEDYSQIFKPVQSIQYSLECRMRYHIAQLEQSQRYISYNLIYEMLDKATKENIRIPRICSVEETYKKIIDDKTSISRYGDGEFQIMLGKAKDVYQDDDAKLAQRLKEILVSNEDGHIVALADDYGCMEGIREENKNVIRKYMTPEKRKQHYQLIDMEKQYYNAYISRPYVIYPHDEKDKAFERFENLKKIWSDKKVVLVEGDRTRMGVGNDLFQNAASVKRIIAPNENAFSVYNEILEKIFSVEKDNIILIALGPTATVLAYDLAKAGYWAIDIGHLDLEYEWFLKGDGYSTIPNKYNNEVSGGTIVGDIKDQEYEKSILAIVK